MRNTIQQVLKTSYTLDEVRDAVLEICRKAREQKSGIRIGYVAGIIKADGPEYIQVNRKRLANYTEHIRGSVDFLIFSATDVFSDEVYVRLGGIEAVEALGSAGFRRFWRELLGSGHITDIFMTPRWQESGGATDEYETAKELGLSIHYVEELHIK